MGNARGFVNRIPKRFTKEITFDGGAGSGAAGIITLGTVTGSILLIVFELRTLVDIVASGAWNFGVAVNDQALARVSNPSTLVAGDFAGSAFVVNQAVEGDIILTIAGATGTTAGKIEMPFDWLPLSEDGNLG